MAEDRAFNRYPRTWARLAFWFGAVVSLAANIASTAVHHGDPLSIGVAAWPPLALLVVTEIMARPGKPKTEYATPKAPARGRPRSGSVGPGCGSHRGPCPGPGPTPRPTGRELRDHEPLFDG